MVHVQILQDTLRGLSFLVAQPLLAVCFFYVLEKPHSQEWLCYLLRSLSSLDRQVCGFPSYNAASNLADTIKSAAL